MLLAAGREVVSKTSAYNITKLTYRVEMRVAGVGKVVLSKLAWSVPNVQAKDVRNVNIYKSISANNAAIHYQDPLYGD